MSPVRSSRALNRRSFLQQSLPAAGLVATVGANPSLLGVSDDQSTSDGQYNCKRLDHKFATLTMHGKRCFGDDLTPRGRVTLVIHFFGLIAFAKKSKLLGGDPMRVLLPKTPDNAEHHHDARLWTLADYSNGENEPLGEFRFWDLYKNGGTRIEIEQEDEKGCGRLDANSCNFPWETFEYVSNLKEQFPKGKIWDDDKLRRGAADKVVTYFGLPGGTMISGVPWSCLGASGIWRYRDAGHLKPRSLTDNISFFKTLPKKQTTVTLALYDIKSDSKRASITLTPKDDIIQCAITHAMPGKCVNPKIVEYVAAQNGANEHSRFYFQIFENEKDSKYPVPVYLRSVRGEPYQQMLVRAKDTYCGAKIDKLITEADPSTDEGHCECATWS
jgi:hypothetical protein